MQSTSSLHSSLMQKERKKKKDLLLLLMRLGKNWVTFQVQKVAPLFSAMRCVSVYCQRGEKRLVACFFCYCATGRTYCTMIELRIDVVDSSVPCCFVYTRTIGFWEHVSRPISRFGQKRKKDRCLFLPLIHWSYCKNAANTVNHCIVFRLTARWL